MSYYDNLLKDLEDKEYDCIIIPIYHYPVDKIQSKVLFSSQNKELILDYNNKSYNIELTNTLIRQYDNKWEILFTLEIEPEKFIIVIVNIGKLYK